MDKTVIPGEPNNVRRDPWFDKPFDRLTVLSKVEGLTTLSAVEGESRKINGNQIILDLGSHPASVFAKASPDRPRDLAGMTNYDPASQVGNQGFRNVLDSRRSLSPRRRGRG